MGQLRALRGSRLGNAPGTTHARARSLLTRRAAALAIFGLLALPPTLAGNSAGAKHTAQGGTARNLPARDQVAMAHPLLDFAGTLGITALPGETAERDELRNAERLLMAAQAPAQQCGASLGARRYGELYRDLAVANEALGDSVRASRNMQRALECAPRDASYQAIYAGELLQLRRFDDTRMAIAQGRDVAPDDLELRSVLLRLNLAQQRWDEAIGVASGLVDDDADGERWVYWQLLLRVAQERRGVKPVNKPTRKSADEWPMPLWKTVAGQLSQSELLREIRAVKNDTLLRQQLCEALFYLGEQYMARGEVELARLHFAAVTRLKILNYVEHDLALAELERLRAARARAAAR